MLYPDIVATAYEIKDRIFNELGFTVNVGIGPCKILAKMASDFEKPNKVHTLFLEEIPQKMWPLPVLQERGRNRFRLRNRGSAFRFYRR